MRFYKELIKGLWTENPIFRIVLGMCPTLAITTSVINAIGMGLAATFVLVCSNAAIAAARNIVPGKVRIPCYIVIIATFVTVADLLMNAFTHELHKALGIFIPLIVVNCIILGRAEAFACKNTIIYSIADGLGMGIGFTLSLGALGAIREVLGSGSLTVWGDLSYSVASVFPSFQPFTFLVRAPGAFICLGLMLCVLNAIGKK